MYLAHSDDSSDIRRGWIGGAFEVLGAHLVTDDLTDLTTDQLQDVLNTLDETLNLGSTTLPDADLEDLDAQQLQAVLRSLEG